MSKMLRDPGWLRFFGSLIALIIAVTTVVSSKNHDVETLKKNDEKKAQTLEKVEKQLENHSLKLMKQETMQTTMRDDIKEVSRDVKTLLQRTSNQ